MVEAKYILLTCTYVFVFITLFSGDNKQYLINLDLFFIAERPAHLSLSTFTCKINNIITHCPIQVKEPKINLSC